MSTITVTNAGDTPVAGEIDLRQAVAAAGAGDTIVFAPQANAITLNSPLIIAAGQDITIDGESGPAYGFGAQGFYGGAGVGISGQIIIKGGASLTLENGDVTDTVPITTPPAAANGVYGGPGEDGSTDGASGTDGAGGGNGAAGADADDSYGVIQNYGDLDLNNEYVFGVTQAAAGAAGGNGGGGGYAGDGANNPNGAGGNGGKGGSGGSGGSGGDGGVAVGAIYNSGNLLIQNSIIEGDATGGAGGAGGQGGGGGEAGSGGNGGNGGVGGNGGNGGNAGAVGASGDGGSAFGAILNAGTLVLAGVDVVNGTATAGAAGAVPGFAYGGEAGYGGNPGGLNGKAGANGAVGVSGKAGAAVDDIGGSGGAAGQATTDAVFFFGGPSTNYIGQGTAPTFNIEVDWSEIVGAPTTASVDWRVVSGPLGPSLSSFAEATSGVLSYTANSVPETLTQRLSLTVSYSSSAPKYEYFTVELYDPSAGSVIAVSTDSFEFYNAKAAAITVSGQPYASYQNIYNADDVLTGREFFNSDGSLYLSETINDLVNGEVVNAFSGGSFFDDLAYSGYDDVYSAGVLVGVDFVYSGGAGEAYSAYQYDYSAGGEFVGSKFFYGAAPGGSGYEFDYDGAGRLTRLAYSGVDAAYSAYEYDYVGGVLSGSKFTYTTVPSGAPYSSYEVDYNQAGALTGDKFFFTGSAGQGFTAEEEDFGANLGVTRVLLTGVQDQAYSSLEIDYDDGAYAGEKAYYLVKGQAYTHEEVDASASGQLEKVIYSGFSGAYSSVEQDFTNGALADTVYGFTDVSGASYYAYQVTDSAGGAGLQETFDLASGAHTEIALAAGQTLTSLGNDKMTGSGATTFVLDAVYGADTITNFTSADTVSLSASEFSQLGTAIAGGVYTGGAAVLSFTDGDTLTFKAMTQATLTGLEGHFTSHP